MVHVLRTGSRAYPPCARDTEKVGGNKSLTVCGSVAEEFHANHSEKCGSYYLKAEKSGVVIESAREITFRVGGNFIRIASDGIYISGTMVHINSGGAPGTGYASKCRLPKRSWQADTVRTGCNMSYNGGAYERGGGAPYGDSKGGGDPKPYEPGIPPVDPPPPSWIEIELVDEYGMPCANEEYEIITPTGDVLRGTLDENGQAHVELTGDGDCRINFPTLDPAEWKRGSMPLSEQHDDTSWGQPSLPGSTAAPAPHRADAGGMYASDQHAAAAPPAIPHEAGTRTRHRFVW